MQFLLENNIKWQERCCIAMLVSLFAIEWPGGQLAGLFFWGLAAMLEQERRRWILPLSVVVVVEEIQCGICWEQGGDATVVRLPCKHKFHAKCVERWCATIHGRATGLRSHEALSCSCPFCRTICFVKVVGEVQQITDANIINN